MKLIDKDALVAEIDNILDYIDEHWDTDYAIGAQRFADKLQHAINTLEVKEVGVWKTVDTINPPQADRNKIYCVLSKNKYLLARVVNHPHDELLQWKCTEFPHHRYDMCEGDKYMQIV